MATEQEWEKAVSKLLSLTRADYQKWRTTDYKRDNLKGVVYATDELQKHIALYEFTYKLYSSGMLAGLTTTNPTLLGGTQEYSWVLDVAIEFVDDFGSLLFRWPKTKFHRELLEAVRAQTAGVEGFLKAWVGE